MSTAEKQKGNPFHLVLTLYDRSEVAVPIDSFDYTDLAAGWKLTVPLSACPVDPRRIISVAIMKGEAMHLLLLEQPDGFEVEVSGDGATMEFTKAPASSAVFVGRG